MLAGKNLRANIRVDQKEFSRNPALSKRSPTIMNNTSRQVDFLIIGQGIAGTLLTHFLLQDGYRVQVIDPAHPHSASRVAAGIINPITGRRFIKSWKIEELLPFARQTYRDIEKQLDIEIFHERGLIRSIFNVRQENDWMTRTGDPAYAGYVKEPPELGAYRSRIEAAHGYGEVRQAAQVDLEKVIDAYRRYLDDRECLRADSFRHEEMKIEQEQVLYEDISARRVVFCEGYWGAFNPFFNYLPFKGDKGDALIVRIPGIHFKKIIKHKVFIVPIEEDRYWIGATYIKQFDTEAPTEVGRREMLRRLQATLKVPFEVIEHRAAVRPTVRDRRPFLGVHPAFDRLAIFNGLGTKGTSLGPLFARHLADFLTRDTPLEEAVNIKRFESFFGETQPSFQ